MGPQSFHFDDVLKQELHQIELQQIELQPFRESRDFISGDAAGLALSGGGPRSVAFSLGVLQALARARLLERVDYLSSTGAGSHIAGWLTAWIGRTRFIEVAERLSVAGTGGAEPAEIQGLRTATLYLAPGMSGSPTAVLTWLRNVLLNLIALGAILGAAGWLIAPLLRTAYIDVNGWFSAVLAGIAALLVRSLSNSPVSRDYRNGPRIFWGAVALGLAAAAVLDVDAARSVDGTFGSGFWWPTTEWLWRGSVVGVFCTVAWLPFPRGGGPRGLANSLQLFVIHVSCALAAMAAESLLLIQVANRTYSPRISCDCALVSPPLVVLSVVLTLQLYLLLMRRRFPPATRDIANRYCRALSGVAVIWLLFEMAIRARDTTGTIIACVLALIFIPCGLLKTGGLAPRSRTVQILLEFFERGAPYVFSAALALVVGSAVRLMPALPGPDANVAAAGVLVVALVLIWRTGANDFTMQDFHKARIARTYLSPSFARTRASGTQPSDDDAKLSQFVRERGYQGPYPIFGASVNLVQHGVSGASRNLKVPFAETPHYWGYESPASTEKGEPAWIANPSPTESSLAQAMATAGPLRGNRRATRTSPPSRAVAFLWSVFDLSDGRWVGNPLRGDTRNKSGPFFGPANALLEGFGGLAADPGFLRVAGGAEIDNLALYELVRRRCGFIVACDASEDPFLAFEDLGDTIRRCRTELGAEIEIDLAPLARSSNVSKAHCQIAAIRYSSGETGMMLYVKPSLTGDEPADLMQYASAHPDFPAMALSNRFDDAGFESYRRLGQHIIETLLIETAAESRDDLWGLSIGQVFRMLGQHLDPGFAYSPAVPVTATPVTAPPVTAPPVTAAPVSAPPAPSDPLPPALVDSLAAGECVLCAGWGLAAQAGLPTWPEFLEGLLRLGNEKSLVDPQTATALTSTMATGGLEAAADELIHQIPHEEVLEYVRTSFSGKSPGDAHRLLSELPFLGVLNLSLDGLLGAAFENRMIDNGVRSPVLVPSNTDQLLAALQGKTFFNANVFGVTSQPSSLLFTAKEFRGLLANNLQFRQFLTTLLLRFTMVFVGSGIDGIHAFLETLELPPTMERRHYALVANSGKLDPVKRRYLERTWNLQVVEYQPQFKHAGLAVMLQEVQSAVNQKAPPKPFKSLVLQNVTLENIGPFEALDLDFGKSWNLLLGDNGVGKTVVLRAIAAALCGDKAEPKAVTRLLRSGSNSGSIRLRVEGREYSVRLQRQQDGTARIVSASLSPLIYDKWLVLGFPALRSVPWDDRIEGPDKSPPGPPTPDDLSPILKSEPDDRLSDLKQWLVNLDYAGTEDSRILLNTFFQVFQTLTPDLKIKFHGIDKKSFVINIATDGGLVPLESISQGTGSVMSWIGTLLERLSEAVSPGKPTEGSALVLIDEIDAHMHPKWQQMFVEVFREQFKNVQVIATSHSPLLVGSLKSEEIWLVHRVPLKSEIYGRAKVETTSAEETEIVVLGPEDDDVEEGQAPAKREERRYRVPAGTELSISDGDTIEAGEALTKAKVRIVAERPELGQRGWRADQILTGPLFELETTRDPETRALLKKYNDLAALESLSEEQRAAFDEVSRKLQVRLPSPQEKETGRKAYELINSFATERLEALEPEDRQKVLDEVKIQLTESITGSRRPE
jgi:hypothetical protein